MTRFGTQTRDGHTCFPACYTKRAATRLAAAWSQRFPEHAPYAVTQREGRPGRLPRELAQMLDNRESA